MHDASHGAGQTRPVTSGKLLVEWRLRAASCQSPLIDEVVPVRDLVVDRAAGVTERDAAIHAARRLFSVPSSPSGIMNSRKCRTRSPAGSYAPVAAVDLQEARYLPIISPFYRYVQFVDQTSFPLAHTPGFHDRENIHQSTTLFDQSSTHSDCSVLFVSFQPADAAPIIPVAGFSRRTCKLAKIPIMLENS